MSMDDARMEMFINAVERLVIATATPNREPRLAIDLDPATWRDLKDALHLKHGEHLFPYGPNLTLVHESDPRCDGRPGFWLMGQWIRRGHP